MHRSILAMAVLSAFALPSAASADPQYRLLVFATPGKYHYEYIPVARDSLERLAKLHSFELTWTDKAESFNGDLSRYGAILFLNAQAEQLDAAERAKFEAYMRAGGNAMVVHRSAIIPDGAWPWFEKLIGRHVETHPYLQTGVVTVADKGFPATFGVPERWVWSDEFYPTTNPWKVPVHPVLDVDELSYDPTAVWPGQVARAMGRDHPVAWWHPYEKGRVFVTALGHNAEMYRDPTYLTHLMGGIYWTATGHGQAR